MTVPIAEIAQQRTVRLVPSRYYDPPVIASLVDQADFADAMRLQEETDKRRRRPPPADNFDDWSDAIIHAAFVHTRVGGNRFNDESRGAWYAAFDERTALHEVAFHKTRELRYIDMFHDTSRYRAVHASFIGRFHDLRGVDPPPPALHEDPEYAYPHGQGLARELTALSPPSRGLIYPSVRRQGGICIVAFHPHVIQDAHPGPEWEIRWSGTPEWTASPL